MFVASLHCNLPPLGAHKYFRPMSIFWRNVRARHFPTLASNTIKERCSKLRFQARRRRVRRGERTQLALRVAIHFANYGEDRELVEIGYKALEGYPRLWELGQAAWDAKCTVQERWRIADARIEESGG
jgi:hypothetical protein